jgi:hypothetical protein
MSGNSELSALVLKLAEIISQQKEEVELLRADVEVLAHSAASNVSGIKARLDRAEEAITVDQPRIVSTRFDRMEARLEEVLSRLNQTNARISRLDAAITDLREGAKEDQKYEEAVRTLAGSPRLSSSMLSALEK